MLETERHRGASRALLEYFSLKPAGPLDVFLTGLMDRYTMIPYENLSKIVRRESTGMEEERLRLPEEVFQNYLERGLGGTCFSLAYYLLSVLHTAGLSAYICMAHMGRRMNVHCVTVVEAPEGKCLLDPGYVITKPVPMRKEAPVFVALPHTYVGLTYDPPRSVFELSTGGPEAMKRRYWFEDVPVSFSDLYVYWQRSFTLDTLNDVCFTMRRGESLIYLHGNYFRETCIAGARSERIKGSLEHAIGSLLGVKAPIVEKALAALHENRRRKDASPRTGSGEVPRRCNL